MNKEYIYGTEVIPFIQSQLSMGNSLSNYVLENKDLTKATARAFLPASSTLKRRENFHSGIFDVTGHESKTQVVNYLIDQMLNLENSIALFDDWVSKPEHAKFIAKHGLEFLIYLDDVYLYVNKANSEQLYEKGIRATCPYPAIGVITQSPAVNGIHSGKEISEELFLELCQGITHLVIGAYDDETHIILSWL